MGSWGYKWDESDGALDVLDGVAKNLRKQFRKDSHPENVRGAAAIVARLRDWMSPEDISLAAAALGRVLSDEDWIQGARDPDKYRAVIASELRALTGPSAGVNARRR